MRHRHLPICLALLSPGLCLAQGPSQSFPGFKQRFFDYLDRAAGPAAELRTAAESGVTQAIDHPSGWGQGATGYGKRFGWWWSENWIVETTRFGVSESFRLDSTYQRSTASTFGPRFRHAIKETFLVRTRSGRTMVSIPSLAAPYIGGLYSTYAWYPGTPTWKQGLKTGSISLALQPGINLVREFVFKH